MRSSTSRPMGLSASAVTTAVFSPKHRFNPRATLYSPPPSKTRNSRAVAILKSPGSSRSITSPRLTRSQRDISFLRKSSPISKFTSRFQHSCTRDSADLVSLSETKAASIPHPITFERYPERRHLHKYSTQLPRLSATRCTVHECLANSADRSSHRAVHNRLLQCTN